MAVTAPLLALFTVLGGDAVTAGPVSIAGVNPHKSRVMISYDPHLLLFYLERAGSGVSALLPWQCRLTWEGR